MLSFQQSALYAGIDDPDMDSMRILSETALRFPDALSFSSGAPYDGNHDLDALSFYLGGYWSTCATRA